MKPHVLFSLKFTRAATGPLPSFYEGRTFHEVAWFPGANSAIAVEQDHNLTGPSRLQQLDLRSDDAKELATLDSYEGGISVSPSGKKAAYFLDKEILELRDLTSPNRAARLRIGPRRLSLGARRIPHPPQARPRKKIRRSSPGSTSLP